MTVKRGVAVCHFNRFENLEYMCNQLRVTLPEDTRIVVCDDGSRIPNADFYSPVEETCRNYGILLIKGENKGVAANKNRALWALQDCHFLAILEDDLIPQEKGWFELYEKAATLSGIHHFCRVQGGLVISKAEKFDTFMKEQDLTMIYGKAPRGDLTFLTASVIKEVGAFHPAFKGAGYAHLHWSERVVEAGLINHPNLWVDVKEARKLFKQAGDQKGGRMDQDQDQIQDQIKQNLQLYLKLKSEGEIYHPLVLE